MWDGVEFRVGKKLIKHKPYVTAVEIKEIINTPKKAEILITALEQYAQRCRTNGSEKHMGFTATEADRREKWREKAKAVESLLSDFVTELI